MKRGTRNSIIVVVALCAIAAGAFAFQSRHAATAATHGAAQAFYGQTLRDADGAMRAMEEHRGKVVVVNFWATWCVPCVQEIPAFSKANLDAGGQVAFVGLGIDSPENISTFNARLRPSYPLVAAGASGTELARAFGNDAGALPFTVVLGTDGRVVASHLGRVDEATLRQWLAPYIRKGAAPS